MEGGGTSLVGPKRPEVGRYLHGGRGQDGRLWCYRQQEVGLTVDHLFILHSGGESTGSEYLLSREARVSYTLPCSFCSWGERGLLTPVLREEIFTHLPVHLLSLFALGRPLLFQPPLLVAMLKEVEHRCGRACGDTKRHVRGEDWFAPRRDSLGLVSPTEVVGGTELSLLVSCG